MLILLILERTSTDKPDSEPYWDRADTADGAPDFDRADKADGATDFDRADTTYGAPDFDRGDTADALELIVLLYDSPIYKI